MDNISSKGCIFLFNFSFICTYNTSVLQTNMFYFLESGGRRGNAFVKCCHATIWLTYC